MNNKLKILISTDSRGVVYGYTASWCNELVVKLQEKANIEFSKSQNRFFTTLWSHLEEIEKNKKEYDLSIIQLGYHEYVMPWTMPVWRSLDLTADDLAKSLSPVPDCNLGGHLVKKCFVYRNDNMIESLFIRLRRFVKKIIFIQLPYTWDSFYERTIIMNEVFSKFCDATVTLPMNKEFPEQHTLYNGIDRVHYLDEYHKIIANLVEEQVIKLFP